MTRIAKGSRLQDINPSRPDAHLPQLSDIDSPFPLQEYIAFMVQQNPHDVAAIVNIPGANNVSNAGNGKEGLGLGIEEKDGNVDEACWIYEQLRRLAQDLTHPLITSLQAECNRTTCPEMKAGEWLYLCVAHGTGPSATMEQCCAIDYITHTLDSATALLNSPRAFPSRLQIPPISTRQFPSLARRLQRIFAHAYYHHREAFEQSEAESSLYARFLLLAKKFDLVPADFLLLPGAPAAPQPMQPPPPSSQPEQHQAPPQQQFQMPTMEIPISEPQPPAVAPSSPEQDRHTQLAESSTFDDGPAPAPAPSYEHMTIRGFPGSEDTDRRTILNRSRTDTMYRVRDGSGPGADHFDLSEFASAAGNALSQPAQDEQHPVEDEDPAHDLKDDEYVEVESTEEDEEAFERRLEADEEGDGEDEQDLAAVTLHEEVDTGVEEPNPTPAEVVQEATESDVAVDKVEDALDEVVDSQETTPAAVAGDEVKEEESAAEASPIEKSKAEELLTGEKDHPHVPLEKGEVKVVLAHLGLDSEPADEEPAASKSD